MSAENAFSPRSFALFAAMLDRPISDVPLVFIDTETTGLNPHFGDRVVEIALARFRGDVMEDYYVSLVNPQRSIPFSVSQIHGITDSDVKDKPAFPQIMPQVREQFDDAVVVGHNAPFDMGFLANEFRLARQEIPNNLVLDTLTLLHRQFSFPSNGLQRVADYMGIEKRGAHRALADVLTTRKVFIFIAEKLAERYNAQTVGDFLNLQGGSVQWREREGANFPLPTPLDEALRQNRKLFIHYEDAFGGRTERWVSPRGVHMQNDIIYLRAYCHMRNDERSFRLDRVIEMRVEE